MVQTLLRRTFINQMNSGQTIWEKNSFVMLLFKVSKYQVSTASSKVLTLQLFVSLSLKKTPYRYEKKTWNLEHWFPTFHLSTELFFWGRSAQNAVKLWLRSEKLVSIKQNIVSNILHNGFFLVYADIAGIYVISKTILD